MGWDIAGKLAGFQILEDRSPQHRSLFNPCEQQEIVVLGKDLGWVTHEGFTRAYI
jgi:hypothetical protein